MNEDVMALVRAYYGPLGWDVDELDPDDLRECMRAMEPVAAIVAERERTAGARALLPVRRYAEAQAVTARANGSEGRGWLDLLHLIDRAATE